MRRGEIRLVDLEPTRDSKAQAEQVCSVAVERIGPSLGRLPPSLLDAVDDALRLHLAL